MKPHIIFYKKPSDIRGVLGVHRSAKLSVREFGQIITSFEKGTFSTLLVPANLVTGWRTRLRADEVDIWFLGKDWTPVELTQGRARVRPKALNQEPAMPKQKHSFINAPEEHVIEEIAELIKEICKARRFGYFSHHPSDHRKYTNLDHIRYEMKDVRNALDSYDTMLHQLERIREAKENPPKVDKLGPALYAPLRDTEE